MKKYVYMKVCDFKEPSNFSEHNKICGYYDASMTFATDLIVTTNHKPREVFQGETVLVMKNGVLYARFESSDDRLYRYVKQRKYRHCSYSSIVEEAIDLAPVEGKRVQTVKKMHLFEICITNTPRNDATVCTVDEHHAELAHVEWNENIKRVESEAVEGIALEAEMETTQQRFEKIDKLLNKSLKAKGA